MGSGYITTKFHIPVVRQGYVVRQRLLDAMGAADLVRLSLITAPAGFGKSTLVVHWIRAAQAAEASGMKFTWLTLDENENSLLQFVDYLIGAVQQVAREFGQDLQTSLLSGHEPDVGMLVRELTNQFAQAGSRLFIVLDDFHVIDDPDVLAVVNGLVEYLPPQVHFLITARRAVALDLPRWRGRGWINEIETNQLRFTLAETQAFFQNTMQLDLDDEAIARLQDRTEGWAAGLQLSGYSLQRAENQAQFWAAYGGGTRHIADYLMAEVFSKQPVHIQQFLLLTSITEPFNASLGAAILEVEPAAVQEILADLANSDLFITALDDENQWYRCHKLFSEFLERQRAAVLAPEVIQVSCLRAARWYGQAGLLVNAVNFSLQARDYEEAARWIAAIDFEQLWEQAYGGMFKSWIPQFPAPVLQTLPQVVLPALAVFLIRSEIQLMLAMYAILEENQALRNELMLFEGVLLRGQGQTAKALALFTQVIAATPEDNFFNHLARTQEALCMFELGDLKRAAALLWDFYHSTGHTVIKQPAVRIQMLTMLSALKNFGGDLGVAEKIVLQGFQYLEQSQHKTPMVGLLYSNLGQIQFVQNDLDGAERNFQEALRWGELSGVTDILFGTYLGLGNVLLARKDPAALAYFERAYAVLRPEGWPNNTPGEYEALRALGQAHLGEAQVAVDWADRVAPNLDDRLTYQNGMQHQAYVAIRVKKYWADGDSGALRALLPRVEILRQQCQAANRVHSELHYRLAAALIYEHTHQPEAAMRVLGEAIETFEATNLVRVFLGWGMPLYELLVKALARGLYHTAVRSLLQAFASEPGLGPPGEPTGTGAAVSLTNREHEILTLIALGLSNKAIQSKLVISPNTLRTHIRNLYGKLGVNSRTQAVKTGQDLELL